MKKTRTSIILLSLIIAMSLATGTLAGPGDLSGNQLQLPQEFGPQQTFQEWNLLEGDGTWVVKIYFEDRQQVNELASWLDPWEVRHDEGYLVTEVTRFEYEQLLAQGYRVEVDEKLTELINRPFEYLPGQISGIPGFPCYRTVEETFDSAVQMTIDYPDLTDWIDIGDSWEKTEPGGEPGYDLMVLVLTNQNITAEKPILFIMASIHAREYTTAELATRYAEHLLQNYGSDADITWLLDHTEIHILLHSNPDGRKKAETGILWRKNTNNNYCANTNDRGADLNRNYTYKWGCCGGSSNSPCAATYRGPSEASEPETQAVESYVKSIFPDQRGPGDFDAAPPDATGLFLDLHSYSRLVLWPWGWTYAPSPNATAFTTLGRKFAYFNGYTPQQSSDLYITDGTTDSVGYGELGVASYTFELGNAFFESCSNFENTIYPDNLPALIYAAKASRLPYMEPAGPDALNVNAFPPVAAPGQEVILSALIDDTRFNNSNGTEPVQNIVEAEYYLNIPPWEDGAEPTPMSAADGSFNSPVEEVTATLDTSGLSIGQHIIYVRGKDALGNWGMPSATFLYICVPITSVELSQQTGEPIRPGDLVTYQALLHPDDASPPFYYEVDFGDGLFWNDADPVNDNPILFTHSFEAPGSYTVEFSATNCGIAEPFVDSLVTVVINENITLIPSEASLEAAPGEQAVYALEVANLGDTEIDVTLSLGESNWLAELSSNLLEDMLPGESASFTVTVDVPVGALYLDSDSLAVTAAIVDSPRIPASASLTTLAAAVAGLGANLPEDDQAGFPGSELAYLLEITNTGNFTESYQIVYTSTWESAVWLGMDEITSGGTIELGPGENQELMVIVAVPEDAGNGASDQVELAIIPQSGEPPAREFILKAWSIYRKLFLPVMVR